MPVTAAIVTAAAAVATTAYTLSRGTPKIPKPPPLTPPPPPPPPPTLEDAEVGAADERKRFRRARGVNSTVLTSPLGVTGGGDPGRLGG